MSSVTQCTVDDQDVDHDERLWLAASAGSHAAFEELQHRYSHRLFKRILAITRNHEDAEDALQETFIRAYVGLRSFEGRSKFSTWLTSIAVNSALMTIRKRRNKPEMPLDERMNEEGEVHQCDLRDPSLNPEQFCEYKQRFSTALQGVRRLEPKMRSVLDIWISQKYSMKEVANDLGISTACVKARLHRARKCLRRSLEVRYFRTESIPNRRVL